jgi:hypothetical protein
MAECTELDCTESGPLRRGLCGRCYTRHWRAGTLPPKRVYACRINDGECAGGYLGNDLCKRHYYRQYAQGTPQLTTLRTAPDDVRYRASVGRLGPADCWPWTGATVKTTGYGKIYWDGCQVSAHVAGWELATGLIPAGFWIDHTCHNRDNSCSGGAVCPHRACQNPVHWEGVTPGVNLARSSLTKASLGWAARGGSEEDLAALAVAVATAGITGTWQLPDCPLGHELAGGNRYVHPERGTVGCRQCMMRTKRFRKMF